MASFRCNPTASRAPSRWALPLVLALLLGSSGCAAVTNPIADGIRVRHLPPELLAHSKQGQCTIPLNLLRQPPVQIQSYRVAPGDVLGVYVEDILGERNQPFPLHAAPPVQFKDQRRLNPSVGYPITVQADGAIRVPMIAPLPVSGLTVEEVQNTVRNTYLDKKLILPTDRVFVSLMQARRYQVIVLRQETGAFTVGPYGPIASGRRGSGSVIELPAYENDVLHALAETGGLPALDAYNQIIIQRDAFHGEHERDAILRQLEKVPADCSPFKTIAMGGETTCIPLRLPGGGPVPIRPNDIVLHNGDVVFLEARDQRWFFTGGLLPPGQYEVPRDYDLDVLQAVAMVRGPLFNGDFGGSNLSGDLVKPGLGNPSATLLIVLRRTPSGAQVPIRVDLRRAVRDARERLLVVPGDVLILQEKPYEAMARYLSQTMFNFDIFWQVFRSSTATGVLDAAAPDRLPARLGTLQLPRP
jgi:protein involved in polysaccharide export with SLBB domain